MHLRFRNINDAFGGIVLGLQKGKIPTVPEGSRNGRVLRIPEPLTITYQKPTERVLFNRGRDCNPFFHLYESLWMLAGKNTLDPLKYFVSTFDQFSDDGKTLNGAYGYRWRRHDTSDWTTRQDQWLDGEKRVDQLEVLIKHLRENPNSRRAVLSMWNVEDDLMKIDKSKDVCCNLSACFSIRKEFVVRGQEGEDWKPEVEGFLDMTVFNRSNDIILGMLGANAVHFSFLQEYVASSLGVNVGVYNQISNNAHVYVDNYKPREYLEEQGQEEPLFTNSVPLVHDVATFDEELHLFVDAYDRDVTRLHAHSFREPFLEVVAKRMLIAFKYHKARDYRKALYHIDCVVDEPWRVAGNAWLLKRFRNFKKKEEGNADLETGNDQE